MNWSEQYPADSKPDPKQIGEFIDSPVWTELIQFLEKNYQIRPNIEYSCCSMARGWNVKYKKAGRAVCTLYPDQGKFTCLVSIGNREADEAEAALSVCTPYVRELYENTKPFQGSRWLMIDVTGEPVLQDVKRLIEIRVRAGQKKKEA